MFSSEKTSILVMDRDTKVRHCLRHLLSLVNCNVLEAEDCDEAKSILSSRPNLTALLLGQRVEQMSEGGQYKIPEEFRFFLGQLPVLVFPLVELEQMSKNSGKKQKSPYCRLNTLSNLMIVIQSLRQRQMGELTLVAGN